MKSVRISQVDAVFADGSYPIEFLFFFSGKIDTLRFRSALKKLSADFWPAFGEYRAGHICFDRYRENEYFRQEVRNQEFDAAEEAEKVLEKFSHNHPEPMEKLIHIKLIDFLNGTVVIPRMNHLAGDGYSYFYLLTTLAAIMRAKSVPFKWTILRHIYKPRHNRVILKEFFVDPVKTNPTDFEPKCTLEFMQISKPEVYKIIKDIKTQTTVSVSTNDLLSAMVLKKLITVQKNYFSDTVYLTMPVDVRRQISEYGHKYYGNALLFASLPFELKKILTAGINEIAVDIRKSIPVINKEMYLSYLEDLEKLITGGQAGKLRPYDPQTGCLVTNLSKLPVDKLDFGSGRPDFVFPLTIEKNSAAILTHQNDFRLRIAY